MKIKKTLSVLFGALALTFPIIASLTSCDQKKPKPMDIDAWKNYHQSSASEFEYTTGGGPDVCFIEKYVGKPGASILLKTSTIIPSECPTTLYLFTQHTPRENFQFDNFCLFIDNGNFSSFGYPNGFALESLWIKNLFVKIEDDRFYGRHTKFYDWFSSFSSLEPFKNCEGINISIDVDSEKANLANPKTNFFQKFRNTDRMGELHIKDKAANPITDLSVWKDIFGMPDTKKIFLD